MTNSSYVPINQAVRTARLNLDLKQSELADRLNGRWAGNWSQGKISRVESSDRELSLPELLQLIDELGVDAFRNTYELDQILEIAGEYTQSLKTAMLDAIDGIESVHAALTRGLS